MKNQRTKYLIAFFSLFYLLLTGCNDSSSGSGSGSETNMVDSGSWYETGFTPWPHDGNPYESENFIIYSDAASMDARQLLSQICEDAFFIIVEKLGLTDLSILRFPEDRNNKIHIYAYKNYTPTDWGGQAYYGGYLIYSPDHPQHTEWGHTALEKYIPLVKHEMVHTVQTLIIGANDERLYSWFAEGIAIEISEDNFYTKIDTQVEFDDLIFTWGRINPISIHYSWTYPEIEGIGTGYLYPIFWLAVRYLTDPFGQGGTFYDVRDVMIDASNEVPFTTSFGNRFGISFAEYENQFFDLMNDYLP